MMVETDQIMPITKLQKELTQTVRKISEDKEPVFISKNNSMAAVIVPFEEYEYLSNLEELYEYTEIGRTIKDRMKNYDPEKSVAWESIKK